MPGSLCEKVINSCTRGDVTDGDVVDGLRRVNHGYLIYRDAGLDAPRETLTRRLSLGEQQRLAFARIVISRPKLVVLDESSSALDFDNETYMHMLIDEMGATCISQRRE